MLLPLIYCLRLKIAFLPNLFDDLFPHVFTGIYIDLFCYNKKYMKMRQGCFNVKHITSCCILSEPMTVMNFCFVILNNPWPSLYIFHFNQRYKTFLSPSLSLLKVPPLTHLRLF